MSGSRAKMLRQSFRKAHGRGANGSTWRGNIFASRAAVKMAMARGEYSGTKTGHDVVEKSELRVLKKIWFRHQHPVPGFHQPRPLFRRARAPRAVQTVHLELKPILEDELANLAAEAIRSEMRQNAR